jgi:hypothetical protein
LEDASPVDIVVLGRAIGILQFETGEAELVFSRDSLGEIEYLRAQRFLTRFVVRIEIHSCPDQDFIGAN